MPQPRNAGGNEVVALPPSLELLRTPTTRGWERLKAARLS